MKKRSILTIAHFPLYKYARLAILWPARGPQCGYLQPLVTTVHCGWRSQHSWSHREAIQGQRITQFIVAKGNNSWEVTVAKIVGTPTDLTEAAAPWRFLNIASCLTLTDIIQRWHTQILIIKEISLDNTILSTKKL